MYGCWGDASYEYFVGRRKRLNTRSYSGSDNKPWNMKWKDAMDDFLLNVKMVPSWNLRGGISFVVAVL